MHAAIITIKQDLHALAVKTAFAGRHGWTCDVIEVDSLADTGSLNWSPDNGRAHGTLPARGGGRVTEHQGRRRAHAGRALPAQSASRYPGPQHVGADARGEQPAEQRRNTRGHGSHPQQVTAAYPPGWYGDTPEPPRTPRYPAGVRSAGALGRVDDGLRVFPVIVLRQHGARLAWPVGQGAPAYLAARDGKPRHRHRKSRGI